MKDIGILMKAAMVQAILREKDPKTVTRRVQGLKEINQDPDAWTCESKPAPAGVLAVFTSKAYGTRAIWTPYGAPGRTLWVRETWRAMERKADGVDGILFKADNTFLPIENSREAADKWIELYDNGSHGKNWRPSLLMPRWVSRITLRRTDSRGPERLQDITEQDAQAEGTEAAPTHGVYPSAQAARVMSYREGFRLLYESIHGKGAWQKNPWLWPVGFELITTKKELS